MTDRVVYIGNRDMTYRHPGPGDSPPTFDQWALTQRSDGCSERTIEERRGLVERFAARTGSDPLTATTDDVRRFLANARDAGLSRASAAGYLGGLRSWFAWLAANGHIHANPCEPIATQKVPRNKPRPVSDEELTRILGAPMHHRTRAMILLAAFEGYRVHEIAKVRGEHFDLLGRTVEVDGKGEVKAVLPLHELVAEIADTMPRRGLWFPTHVGNRFGPAAPILSRSVSTIVGNVMRRTGVKPGAHRLRHWYATALLAAGADLRIVQELMRHASIQSTQIYTQVTFEQQRRALTRLHAPGDIEQDGQIAA